MKLFILSIFVTASLGAQNWPAFKTTFGSFWSQPRTRAEAEGQGWVLLSSCTEMFLGHRFANPADDSIVLIFDDAGFIAGSQSVIPASVADASAMARNPAYQLDRWLTFDMDAYFTTIYFVDPQLICGGGRTQEMFDSQGTGDRLLIQVGEKAIDSLVTLPLSKAEAESDPAWFDHFCFIGMGDHFIQFDYTPDQDCQLILPLQLLFDDGYDGVVNGFVWQHFVMIDGLDSGRWEHPDRLAIMGIVDRPPQCVWDALDTTGMTTMHHYFWDYPLFILCPLKYEKTVRGYRNLMASIMEK